MKPLFNDPKRKPLTYLIEEQMDENIYDIFYELMDYIKAEDMSKKWFHDPKKGWVLNIGLNRKSLMQIVLLKDMLLVSLFYTSKEQAILLNEDSLMPFRKALSRKQMYGNYHIYYASIENETEYDNFHLILERITQYRNASYNLVKKIPGICTAIIALAGLVYGFIDNEEESTPDGIPTDTTQIAIDIEPEPIDSATTYNVLMDTLEKE